MRSRPLILPITLAGVGLWGCGQSSQPAQQAAAPPATGAPIASLPLAQGAPPALALAPPPSELPPPAQPVRVARAKPQVRYRYLDEAYSASQAFADSPPDYTIDYQGVRPWVWRSQNGDYRVLEQTPQGERTYFYRQGQPEPYLVRDPQYAFGYDGDQLAVIYDGQGRPTSYDPSAADRAARYLARARDLYEAINHQQRQAVYAAAWRARREAVLEQQRAWEADQARQAEWRAYRAEHQAQDEATWERERAMREAYAARVAAQVSADPGYGPPPPAYPGAGYDRADAARREQQRQADAAAAQAAQQAQLQARAQAEAAQRAQADQARNAELSRQAQAQAQAAAQAQAQAAAWA